MYSSLHTKGWRPEQHPIGLLYRAGFNVTINTDNRLMSRTSMTREIELLREVHGFTDDDVARVTVDAVQSAFCGPSDRQDILAAVGLT